MPNATSAMPGGVAWTGGAAVIGRLAPTALSRPPALCRSPARDVPCTTRAAPRHGSAPTRATDTGRARLNRGGEPPGVAAMNDCRVIYHAPICPGCGSFDITATRSPLATAWRRPRICAAAAAPPGRWPASATGGRPTRHRHHYLRIHPPPTA